MKEMLQQAHTPTEYNHSLNNEHDKAIEAYNKAISLNPNLAEAYNNRGAEYNGKGQHDRAIEDFNKAIALNPNDADAYNNRGISYTLIKDNGKACIDWKRACELGDCSVYKSVQQEGLCK